jgi:polyribonucleotide nucleotidyltransferase
MEWAGRTLRFETGRLARQANSAVVCEYGNSAVLATVGMTDQPVSANFLPLRVDFEEKMYAVGRIPGGFFKREGRPSDEAILVSRRIDRPIRPLLPSGLRHDVQIIATPLSAENETSIELISMIAASAAMSASSVPFDGPMGVAQIGRLDGEFIVNPSFQQVSEGDMSLVVVGTRKGIIMLELQAEQVLESVVAEAMELGFAQCIKIMDLIEEFTSGLGIEKPEVALWAPRPEIVDAVRSSAYDRIAAAIELPDKKQRERTLREIEADLASSLAETFDAPQNDIQGAVADIMAERLKKAVLDEGRRLDGRAFDQTRDITAEVGLFRRVHGSALFQRGDTQVMTITTLGAIRDQRMVRTLEQEEYQRFMHHYNFPPFSTGEVRPMRAPGRREIGHGFLAQNALEPVLPPEDDFPYTIRLVSEALESNGSTSMAAACGATLSLMDAGVPIKAPVAGISIGLVWDGPDRYQLLTDIQGIEDFEGYMDFKVAGTRLGITAIQMDTKTDGLPMNLLVESLEQACAARIQILDIMAETIPYPRTELSTYAPRMFALHIDPAKIGSVIGPGGRVVRKMQEDFAVEIDIRDDGTVYIFGVDSEKADAAREAIADLTREVQVGEVFTGRVVSTLAFGAFVEILPGREGLLHISNLAWEHVDKTEDVVKVGDMVEVKVLEVDDEGKLRLSRKDLLPKPEGYTERPREPRREGGGREGGGREGGRSGGGRDGGGRDGGRPRGGRR